MRIFFAIAKKRMEALKVEKSIRKNAHFVATPRAISRVAIAKKRKKAQKAFKLEKSRKSGKMRKFASLSAKMRFEQKSAFLRPFSTSLLLRYNRFQRLRGLASEEWRFRVIPSEWKSERAPFKKWASAPSGAPCVLPPGDQNSSVSSSQLTLSFDQEFRMAARASFKGFKKTWLSDKAVISIFTSTIAFLFLFSFVSFANRFIGASNSEWIQSNRIQINQFSYTSISPSFFNSGLDLKPLVIFIVLLLVAYRISHLASRISHPAFVMSAPHFSSCSWWSLSFRRWDPEVVQVFIFFLSLTSFPFSFPFVFLFAFSCLLFLHFLYVWKRSILFVSLLACGTDGFLSPLSSFRFTVAFLLYSIIRLIRSSRWWRVH